MHIRYRLTERDFGLISLYIYYRRPLNLFVVLAIPVFMFLQFRNSGYNLAAVPPVGYLLPVFVLLVLPLSVWFGAVRAFRRNGLLSSETELQADQGGIRFRIGESQVDYQPEDLTRLISFPGFLVLQFKGRSMHPVPLGSLSPSDLAALRQLAPSRKKKAASR